MNYDKTSEFRKEFEHFDTDNSGALSRDEIKAKCRKSFWMKKDMVPVL